ncbi:MAG: CopG family transcriptional regulator [Candidatus Dormibacteria bacterium]
MAATRTQVYLTTEQRRRIDDLITRNGQSLAWVIREALDQYLAAPGADRQTALDATFGALPRLSVPSREEWNRFPAGRTALGLPSHQAAEDVPASRRRRA